MRAAALAAGATSRPLPPGLEAVARFRRIATPEVAAVCDRPGPLAAAELWRLAADWKVGSGRALTGALCRAA